MDTSTLAPQAPTDVSYFTNLLGPTLLRCNNNSTMMASAQAVEGQRLIALYFSAHWCPPCRQFTPMLAEFYSTVKEESPWDLEVVFVSSDRDPGGFRTYVSSMPWLAVPFEDRGRAQMIGSRYGVQGLPTLVVLDGLSGQVVAQQSARNDVTSVAYRGGDDAVKSVLQKWCASAPEESKSIMESIELSLKDAAEEGKARALEEAQTAYLVRKVEKKQETTMTTTTPADRIKVYFATLVASGKDPTTAAAEAIHLVAQENAAAAATAAPLPPQLEGGSFDSAAWSVIQSLDCVSVPSWQTEDSTEFVYFSDAVVESSSSSSLGGVCGVRFLASSSSSSSTTIVGLQSVYANEVKGIVHRRNDVDENPSKDQEQNWSECVIVEGVRKVEGVIGPMGVTSLCLVGSSSESPSKSNNDGEEESNDQAAKAAETLESSFTLVVPEGFNLAGFHGTFGSSGLVSLGLVCCRMHGENLLHTQTTQAEDPSINALPLPNIVTTAATNVLHLNQGDKNASAKTVLTTAKKYLDNAMRDAFNPKFRSFKLSNKVSDRVCQVPGGLDLLCALGFSIFFVADEFHVGLPLGANLEGMDQAIRLLLEHLEKEG